MLRGRRDEEEELAEIAALLSARRGHHRRHGDRLNTPVFAVLVVLSLLGAFFGVANMNSGASQNPPQTSNQPTSSFPVTQSATWTPVSPSWNYVALVVNGTPQAPFWMNNWSPNVPDLSTFGSPNAYSCLDGYIMISLGPVTEANLVTYGTGGNSISITQTSTESIFPVDVILYCAPGEAEFYLYWK